MLRDVGPVGVLPSKIAYWLNTYGVDRLMVTRTIEVTNRRLQKELGYEAAEKVGHRWALTDFMLTFGVVKNRRSKDKHNIVSD